MVLCGRNTITGTTCWLFKMRPLENLKGKKEITPDNLNVFCAFPLHTIFNGIRTVRTSIYKMRVQICGNQNVQITTPIYCDVVLFPVQHPCLDFAMGVVENPEIINDNPELNELSYFEYTGEIYEEGGAINKEVDIIYVNKSGYVNKISSTILDMNYEIGTIEQDKITHETPYPGGYILLEEPAKTGISGSILIYNDQITGLLSISSAYNQTTNDTLNESKCLAVDMYYIYPHIVQCTDAIHRFTLNDPNKLQQLSNYRTMETLQNELMPVVCSLGVNYVFEQITNNEPIKIIALKQLHEYLKIGADLGFTQDARSDTIRISTILNTNTDFVNYFFSKDKSKSQVLIRQMVYYDKIFNENVVIDFEENTIYANVLDYCFRADPAASIELTVQTKILNRDSSMELTPLVTFKFDPSPTTDIIYNQPYSRTTAQLPKVFFNKNSALYYLSVMNCGMRKLGNNNWIKLSFLSKANRK